MDAATAALLCAAQEQNEMPTSTLSHKTRSFFVASLQTGAHALKARWEVLDTSFVGLQAIR